MESNSSLLQDKVCLITGAGRGIGQAIAAEFARAGAVVYLNDLDPETTAAAAANIAAEYQAVVIPLAFDVTETDVARQAFMQIRKEQLRLDVLVNNAGVMQDALIGMISRDMIQKTMTVNVQAVIEMTQWAVKLMSRQNHGSIINLASIIGVHGNPGQTVYSASKGAVIALTKSAAKELAPHNIRVNALAPGMIDTAMFRSIGAEKKAERIANIGLGRIGTPQDVAAAALFLASDLSQYITGQIIGVDGAALV